MCVCVCVHVCVEFCSQTDIDVGIRSHHNHLRTSATQERHQSDFIDRLESSRETVWKRAARLEVDKSREKRRLFVPLGDSRSLKVQTHRVSHFSHLRFSKSKQCCVLRQHTPHLLLPIFFLPFAFFHLPSQIPGNGRSQKANRPPSVFAPQFFSCLALHLVA